MDKMTRKMVIQLCEDGFSVSGIASSLSISEDEVSELIDKFGNLIKPPKLSKTIRARVFELRAEGKTTAEIAEITSTLERTIVQSLEKDKSKIKNDPRAVECLEMYKNGASLEEIGQKFNITRERVRQITRKQFGYSLGYGPVEQKARKAEIAKAYRSIVSESRTERQQDIILRKYDEAIEKGYEPQYFDNFQKYHDATGISKEALEEFLPEAYRVLSKNARIKSRKWSWHYDACRMCGTTSVKHRGYGYCKNCHPKSPEFKEAQRRSHLKNRDAILKNNKRYAEDYYNRPEVIEKLDREYDLKYFGGNRKLALERDGNKCIVCGMSTNVKDAAGRAKVRVWHLGDKDDHSLQNLGTYCQSCLFKDKGINPFNKFGRG